MICQQRYYREKDISPDQAQNIWKSEISQSLAMKQAPKEQAWSLLKHEKYKQIKMGNDLSLCPQITYHLTH